MLNSLSCKPSKSISVFILLLCLFFITGCSLYTTTPPDYVSQSGVISLCDTSDEVVVSNVGLRTSDDQTFESMISVLLYRDPLEEHFEYQSISFKYLAPEELLISFRKYNGDLVSVTYSDDSVACTIEGLELDLGVEKFRDAFALVTRLKSVFLQVTAEKDLVIKYRDVEVGYIAILPLMVMPVVDYGFFKSVKGGYTVTDDYPVARLDNGCFNVAGVYEAGVVSFYPHRGATFPGRIYRAQVFEHLFSFERSPIYGDSSSLSYLSGSPLSVQQSKKIGLRFLLENEIILDVPFEELSCIDGWWRFRGITRIMSLFGMVAGTTREQWVEYSLGLAGNGSLLVKSILHGVGTQFLIPHHYVDESVSQYKRTK